jgi:hypothetical protein
VKEKHKTEIAAPEMIFKRRTLYSWRDYKSNEEKITKKRIHTGPNLLIYYSKRRWYKDAGKV